MSIPNYAARFEGQYSFIQIGVLSAEQAVLAVSERDNATVAALAAAKRVIWRPDDGCAGAEIRFRVDGHENEQFAVHIYAARGADYYQRVGTLTLDQGTQDWSGGHFVDVVVLSNDEWGEITVENTVDEIGRVYLNTKGYDRFVFLSPDMTDDNITHVYIDIARRDMGWDL